MQLIMSSRPYGNRQLFKKHDGAVLFVSLVVLVVLTILGLAALQRSSLQERMGINSHVSNIAFNSAESAIGGFVVDANTGNKLEAEHILSVLRNDGNIASQCYNEAGQWLPCDGTTFLDGDRSGGVIAQMDAVVTEECNVVMCGGFSLGGSGSSTLGCRVFQINGTGQVATTQVSNSLWAYEVTVCSN